MSEKPFTIQVNCHAGYRGEETPVSFSLHNRHIKITKVVDRWLDPDHRYFKVIGDDGSTYIIRHDPHNDQWELTMFDKTGVLIK